MECQQLDDETFVSESFLDYSLSLKFNSNKKKTKSKGSIWKVWSYLLNDRGTDAQWNRGTLIRALSPHECQYTLHYDLVKTT